MRLVLILAAALMFALSPAAAAAEEQNPTVTMNEAVQTVRNMLDKFKVKYTYDDTRDGRYVFALTYRLSNTKLAQTNVTISVIASKKNPENCARIMSYGYIGLKADENNMASVAEFLHRANYDMTFGNFELDYNDGEIRYKMALNCTDKIPGDDAVRDALIIPLSMIERYGDGLLSVMMSSVAPKDAIEKIES